MDEFNEQLSAMVDDELRPEETRLLIRQVTRLPDAAERVGRYLLVRAALHGNLMRPGHADLAARIALALEAEPALSSARSRHRTMASFARPVAGFVIAASVATVAIVLWPRPELSGPQQADSLAVAPAAVAPAGVAPVALNSEPESTPAAQSPSLVLKQWEGLDPRVREQLNTYLVDHSVYSTDSRFNGATTYVRIAAQEGK